MPSRHHHVLFSEDWLYETCVRTIDRWPDDRRQWFGIVTKGLVEAAQVFAFEARSEWGAWLVHHLADPLESQAPHQRLGAIRQTQCCDGKLFKGLPFLTWRDNGPLSISVAGDRPGGSGRIGDGKTRCQPEHP